MQAIWSEHWHAVRFLRPRLRHGVQALHRPLRGRAWVLLLDPVTQRFHRMSPQVWGVLQLLDGRRTLDEIWTAACAIPARPSAHTAVAAHASISQTDLLQLMSSLHANDLLQSQVSPDAAEVLSASRSSQACASSKAGSTHSTSACRCSTPMLGSSASRPGAPRHILARAAVMADLGAAGGWAGLAALDRIDRKQSPVLAASNVALLWLTYPLVKAVHEWAHGLAVKAFGGTVREIGLMFMVFTPVPYVDATSSYRFPSKWARALVAAAGIMAELVLGAIAMYVWLLAEPGLVTAVAFNVILIAGVSTVLINGNPLMRYDGYFIACDLLEVPNLGQRASQYCIYLLDRYGFGARDAQPPLQVQGERGLLLAYGLVSPVYRIFITFGLIWFVATEYLFVGAVMALMALWSAVVQPLWKGWKHLRQSATLASARSGIASQWRGAAAGRRLHRTGATAFPLGAPTVVWVPDEAIVRAESSGQVVRAGSAGRSGGGGRHLAGAREPGLERRCGRSRSRAGAGAGTAASGGGGRPRQGPGPA
ncbi:M50 family metallopeptidase [Roseateles sp. GG27B]